MEELQADFLDGVRRGAPSADSLQAVGDPDSAGGVKAFRAAAADPDLGGCLEAWASALLLTARPGQGAQRLLDWSQATRDLGQLVDASRIADVATVLGSSDFLGRLLLRHPDWFPRQGDARVVAVAADAGPDWTAIREVKYRGLLRVALGDLTGRPFEESLCELSDLADQCLQAAMRATAVETGDPEPALLALGKLGGRELNFSSDVDLLFLYESPEGEDDRELSQAATRFIRHFKKSCETPSPDGFIHRVDLDLRPEGKAGALSNSLTAALDYYETFGAEWERQMLIRLRWVAGPEAVAQPFVAGIRPFVYRRSIDPGALENVRAMKERIEFERREAGRDLDYELKEGPGGIRDVEFVVQALQLLWGGREPDVRTGNTLDGLAALAEKGLLDGDAASTLSDAYRWLRRAEHALQLAEERQTQRFPKDRGAQTALARRMGYREPLGRDARDQMLDDWTSMRAIVRQHFEALITSGAE